MSDLFGHNIVGFPMRRLKYFQTLHLDTKGTPLRVEAVDNITLHSDTTQVKRYKETRVIKLKSTISGGDLALKPLFRSFVIRYDDFMYVSTCYNASIHRMSTFFISRSPS